MHTISRAWINAHQLLRTRRYPATDRSLCTRLPPKQREMRTSIPYNREFSHAWCSFQIDCKICRRTNAKARSTGNANETSVSCPRAHIFGTPFPTLFFSPTRSVQYKHAATFDTHQTTSLQKVPAEQRTADVERGKLNPLDMTVSQRQTAANRAALQHSQFVQAPPPRQLQRPTTPARVFSSESPLTETSYVLPSWQTESAFEPSQALQNRFNVSTLPGRI